MIAVIGYIIGIIWGLYFNFSVALLYFPLIAIYFISRKMRYSQKRKFKINNFKRYFRYLKIYLNQKSLSIIILVSIISNSIVLFLNNKYDTFYQENKEIQVLGVIVSNVKENDYSDFYTVKLKAPNKYVNKQFYLKINHKLNTKLGYGDLVSIKGVFEKPDSKRNYGGFDYKEYLKTLKIYGTINVEQVSVKQKEQVNLVSKFANKINLEIKNKIQKFMNSNEANIFQGLILGDTSMIDDETKEEFRATSISHILAVSGMHISYIIMGVSILLKKFLGKRKTKIIIIVVLLLYMLITGFSSSLFRASLMGILVILSEILYRKNDIWNSISISLFILLIYNPFLITNVGLQFSYLGTIGIILFNKTILNIFKRKKENSITLKIKEMLSVTISAQIMILPIMIYHFNIFSVYFFISNLFVSIIIGPIIILGLVTIILSFFLEPIAEILFCILEIAIKLLLSVTSIR